MSASTEPLRVAVLLSGRGSNLGALIKASQRDLPIALVGAFSNKADAPRLRLAAAAGIPTQVLESRLFPDRAVFEQALFAAVAASGAELVVLAGFMRVLGAASVEQWRGRLINRKHISVARERLSLVITRGQEVGLAASQAFADAAGGRPTSAFLRGVSGAGKTALGQQFLADLADRGDAVVLTAAATSTSRCRSRRSTLIDALSDHLLLQPPDELSPLLGAHTGELTRVFPVFERISQVKEAARVYLARTAAVPATAGTEHESRRRAFAAHKRLLYALALRRPLVLAIDDLHWTDGDIAHKMRH